MHMTGMEEFNLPNKRKCVCDLNSLSMTCVCVLLVSEGMKGQGGKKGSSNVGAASKNPLASSLA